MKKLYCVITIITLFLSGMVPGMGAASAKAADHKAFYLEFDQIEELLTENNLVIQANKLSREILINNLNDLEDDEEDYDRDRDREKDNYEKQINIVNELLKDLKIKWEALRQPNEENQNKQNEQAEGDSGKDSSPDITPGNDTTDPENNSSEEGGTGGAEDGETGGETPPQTEFDLLLSIIKAQNRLTSLQQQQNTLPGSDDMGRLDLQSQIVSLENSILQVEQSNDQIIREAQNLFLSWHFLTLDEEEASAQLDEKEYERDLILRKIPLGLAKEEEVEAIDTQIDGLHTTQENLLDQKEDIVIELNYLLNQDYDTDLKLGSLPGMDKELLKINYDSDRKKARNSSYTWQTEMNNRQLKSIAMDKAEEEDDDDSDGYRQAEADYKQQVQTVNRTEQEQKDRFSSLYQAVKDRQTDYANAKQDMAEAEEDNALTQLKYNLGMINGQDRETARLQLRQQEVTVKRADLSILQAYLDYQWMVKGLSPAQTK